MSAFVTGLMFGFLCYAAVKRDAVETAIFAVLTLYFAIAWYGSA